MGQTVVQKTSRIPIKVINGVKIAWFWSRLEFPMVEPIPTFDFSVLSAFFASGGGLSQSLRAEVLRQGKLASFLKSDPAVIPPWELPPAQEITDLSRRALSPDPVIDKNDPLFDRTDLDSDSKVLFASYKALRRLNDMAEFAESREGEPLGLILDGQFQRMVQELREFIDQAQYDRLSLDLGLLSAQISSLVNLSQVERAPEFRGAPILDNFAAPVPGINTTDRFTIESTDAAGTVRTVTITMNDISADPNDYTLTNIVTHINTKLVDAGIATSLVIERYSETSFGIRMDIGFDETVTLTPANGTESEAVYISGIRGSGELGSGYIAKVDNLAAADPNETFFHQIDTLENSDRANAVAVDSNGDVYVVGSTSGDLGDQKVNPSANDVFLQKYDAAGNLLFTRRLGAPVDGVAFAVKVDSNDNVFVAGQVHGILTETGHGANYDSFVTKFDKAGIELFTRQAAPFANDGVASMAINSDDEIFLAGFTHGEIAPGEGFGGNTDAFVTKLDNDGTLIYNRQLGGRQVTPDGSEENIDAIAVSPDGTVWVAGEDDESIFIAHYDDADNSPLKEGVRAGNAGTDKITSLAVDAAGNVYGAGFASVDFFPGQGGEEQEFHGGLDAFVFVLNPANNNFLYRTFIGTNADEKAHGISVNPATGEAYVVGETTGTLAGETSSSKVDNFVVKLNANGGEVWRHQFGGGYDSRATGVVYDTNGTNILSRLGFPNGKVPPDSSDLVTAVTSARAGDYFYMSINDGPHQQILIEDDDTFGFLAFKVRKALGVGIGTVGSATFVDDDISGRFLQVSALNGNKIELIKGSEGLDALEAIGFREKTLFGEIPDDGTEDFVQTAFGLGFTNDIAINTREKADEAKTLINFGEITVQKAFRLLTQGPDPEFELPTRPNRRILDQIASMQVALQRLQSVTASANANFSNASLLLGNPLSRF